MLGFLLAGAGCSFDSRPNSSGTRSNAAIAWMPPSAAGSDRDRDASTASLDGATDAMPSQAVAVQPTTIDAGAPAQKPTTPSAGAAGAAAPAAHSGGPRDNGASHADRMDAGKPEAPKADASQPSDDQMPDGQKPDAARPNDQTPNDQKPDAATRDASPASTHCRPGLYTGTFSGSIQLVGLSLSTVTGTVRAQLTPGSPAEHLELRDGRVMGLDQDGNRLTVNLTGTVNCQTNQLEDGKLENGNFHNVGSDSDTAFIGTAQGTYSSDPHSLVGTFSVEAPDTLLIGGRGTWSLIRNE